MITRIKLSTMKQDLPKYRSMLAGNPAYVPTSFESIASASPSGVGTVTFSSIPGTYKHLQVRYNVRADNPSTGPVTAFMQLRVNGVTTTSYTTHQITGDGASVSNGGSSGDTSTFIAVVGGSGNVGAFGSGIIDIYDYASTTKNKTIRAFSGSDTNGTFGGVPGEITLRSGLFNNTGAITSLELFFSSGTTYMTNSVVSLYGIRG